jgi:hypothetical protein
MVRSFFVSGGQDIAYHNRTSQRIIESFDQLDDCTFPATTRTNECDMSTTFDHKIEVPENVDARTSWISEMNVAKLDSAVDRVEYFPLGQLRINFRAIIKKFDDLCASNMRLRYVWDELEGVSGLNRTKCNAL